MPTHAMRLHEWAPNYGLEFVYGSPAYADALAGYETADYKKALAVLGPGVKRDFRNC
jgi:hypothetical protein